MRKREPVSTIAYGTAIVFGILGVGLSCFFGFGGFLSGVYGASFLFMAVLMALLIAFGYRGLKERRRLGDETWWHLLLIGLIAVTFLAFLVVFIFVSITLLTEGWRS